MVTLLYERIGIVTEECDFVAFCLCKYCSLAVVQPFFLISVKCFFAGVKSEFCLERCSYFLLFMEM